jgi:hypothetical protein
LVAGATLAARRWGPRVGGLVSAFPAVVGPVLVLLAEQRGVVFAARAANGTLLGLVALSAFTIAYGQAAARLGWVGSLAVGWISAAVTGLLMAVLGGALEFPAGLALAAGSLAAARRAIPVPVDPSPIDHRPDLRLRIAITAVLVLALTGAAELLGPLIGGVLTALPVLTSVLACFTHRNDGAGAAVALLRGMVEGMAGFVAFTAVVALIASSAGIVLSFTAATLTATAIQGIALLRRPPVARNEAPC